MFEFKASIKLQNFLYCRTLYTAELVREGFKMSKENALELPKLINIENK